MYEQYAGFRANLIEKMADVDTDLPINAQHIAQLKNRLYPDKYTYLQITDGTELEVVRVGVVGSDLYVTRGLELTKPTTFAVGSCVYWELTPMAVQDIICQMPCCEE